MPAPQVRIFSRNCEDHTSAFPDVVAAVRGAAAAQRVTSVVLDAELVAVDPSTGRLRAFQELATRKRGSVAESEVLVQVRRVVLNPQGNIPAEHEKPYSKKADARCAALGCRLDDPLQAGRRCRLRAQNRVWQSAQI